MHWIWQTVESAYDDGLDDGEREFEGGIWFIIVKGFGPSKNIAQQ